MTLTRYPTRMPIKNPKVFIGVPIFHSAAFRSAKTYVASFPIVIVFICAAPEVTTRCSNLPLLAGAFDPVACFCPRSSPTDEFPHFIWRKFSTGLPSKPKGG